MKLRIDYHSHPNLSKINSIALKKCKKWWRFFEKNKINCVLITEHAYKNPRRAFEFMNKTKPKGFFCFPGVECVTKEGVDIVIFSNNPKIYKLKQLAPLKTTYNEIIKLVCSKKYLYSYVTHPYTLGLTSVINKLGNKVYKDSVKKLGALEISNGAFDNLECFFRLFPLRFFFKSKLSKISLTKHIPKKDYPKPIKFLAAGSDAHFPEDLGNHFEINTPSKTISENKVFQLLSKNKGKGRVVIKNKKLQLFLLIISGLTSAHEFFIKLYLRCLK
jgi:hypothetical protein